MVILFNSERAFDEPFFSGNGLVSYYMNIVLNSVGITSTETKTAINGGLQVSHPCILSLIGHHLI